MLAVEHYHPEVLSEEGENRAHILDLMSEGRKLGEATLVYKNAPFPFYYVASISVRVSERGRKNGSGFLLEINKFLKDKKKTGILLNSMSESNPAHNMYRSNGWKEIDRHSGYFIFNSPADLGPDRIDKAVYEIDRLMKEKEKE